MKNRTAAIWAGILIAAYIIMMLPMFGVSFYAHPAHDDYWYSKDVYRALSSGRADVFSVLSEAFQMVKNTYFRWQGTYSAIFLMALQPGVFSQDMYFITTFVMLFSLTAGTFVFAFTVVKRLLGQKGVYSLPVGAALLILSVEFAPDVHQGFFWWNGSVLYMFFYGMALVYFALLIDLFTEKRKGMAWTIAAFLCILGAWMGGSNFSMALFTCEITVLFSFCAFIKKINRAQTALVLFVLLSAFFINVFAPGNFVRMQDYKGQGAVAACLYSVAHGAVFALGQVRLPVIAYLMAFTPMFIFLAKNSGFQYKRPLIVIPFAALLFCSLLTPSIFAMGEVGPGRQQNIYYTSSLWLMTFSYFYMIGWAVKRGISMKIVNRIAERKAICALALVLMIALGCVMYGVEKLPVYRTAVSLVSGEAEDYDRRYNEMLNEILSSDKVCVTKGMDEAPPFLSPIYLSTDADFWVNDQMEAYFALEEIRHE